MTNTQRSKEANHWRRVIQKYNSIQRPLTSDERQQRELASHNLEKLYACSYPNCGCVNNAGCIH